MAFGEAQTPKTGDVKTSAQTGEIFKALVAAQAQIGPALADKENTFHKSRYADLASVVEAIRGPFAANGLAYMQFPMTRHETVERSYREPVEIQVGRYPKKVNRPVYQTIETGEEGSKQTISVPMLETVPVIYVLVRTRIVHCSGEWIESDLEIPVAMEDNPAQAVGKTTTYARRYSLMAMAGVAPEDDDGNSLAQQEYQHDQYTPPNYPEPAAQPNRAPARPAPTRPQGADGRFAFLCERMRKAENLNTLRAFFESSQDELRKSKGTPEQISDLLDQLTAVKDQVKATLSTPVEQPVIQKQQPAAVPAQSWSF